MWHKMQRAQKEHGSFVLLYSKGTDQSEANIPLWGFSSFLRRIAEGLKAQRGKIY